MNEANVEIWADDRPLFPPRKRASRWTFALFAAAVIVVAAIAVATFYFLRDRAAAETRPPAPAVEAQPARQAGAEPRVQYPVDDARTAGVILPALGESDLEMQDALAGLFGKAALAALLHPQDVIRNFVATVDNLPRKTVALRLLPVKPVTGRFRATGPEGRTVISPNNGPRYAPYVRALEAVDTKRLVSVYVYFYPLFQQAYMELGYPTRYFNDRVVEVIDHLLATPDVRSPIMLVQPKVLYEYADPELQELSAGQKMMLRIGSENAARIKAKLREIRQALTRA